MKEYLHNDEKNMVINKASLINSYLKIYFKTGQLPPSSCIVDTSHKFALGYATIVESRSSNVLIPIINQVVKAGNIIHSDEWKTYRSLADNDAYYYATVCHKYNFVDPISGVHTQHLESYNNRLKREIGARKRFKHNIKRKIYIRIYV